MNAVTKLKLADIEERYDVMVDMYENSPVTWPDLTFLRAVRELFERGEAADARIAELEERAKEED